MIVIQHYGDQGRSLDRIAVLALLLMVLLLGVVPVVWALVDRYRRRRSR